MKNITKRSKLEIWQLYSIYFTEKCVSVLYPSSRKKTIPKMLFARWKRKRRKNIHDGIRAHLSNGMKPLNDLSNGYRARWHWFTHTPHNFLKSNGKGKKICEKKNPKSQKRTSLSGELTWLQSNRFKRWMSGCVFVVAAPDHTIPIAYVHHTEHFLCGIFIWWFRFVDSLF